jgi:hypothetical protein
MGYVYPFMQGMPKSGGLITGSLQWSDIGYYDQDISYHFRDAGQLAVQGGFGKIHAPQTVFYDSTSQVLTNAVNASGLIVRGFPLMDKSSLLFVHQQDYSLFDKSVNDPWAYFRWNSQMYWNTSTSAEFNLPVASPVDRGKLYYFDALYASVGMMYLTRANSESFEMQRGVDKYTYVTAGLKLGVIKSYQFFGMASVKAFYNIENKQLRMNLTIGL